MYAGIKSEWVDGSLVFTEKGEGKAPLFQIGKFVSAASGAEMVLNSTKTKAFAVYADDGGVALSGSDIRASISRLLVTTAIADTDLTLSGHVGHIKICAVDTSANTSYVAGLRGYLEIVAGGTVCNSNAIRACVELPSTAVIASGGCLAGVLIDAITLGGTHTGKAACVHVPDPGAGVWDFLLKLGSSAITLDTSTISGDLTPTGFKGIPILIGSTTYLIPIATAWA